MILRRLHLHPFGGAADREVSFTSGLNVILGPNEAGKSTLRRALRHALFIPTKLTKREAEAEILPHLPLGGGDTIRVSLEFTVAGEVWKLSKRWASGNSSVELTRPDGGLLSDSAAVEETLGGLLGLSRGTWEHVLMAPQGQVGTNLDRLDAEGDLRELNERLRRAVFETDGVSLETLGSLLEARLEAVFGRWDRTMKRPEANRGLEQRWSRGAGRIVNAWYEREAARLALERAETYYRRLDELNAALAATHAANEELADWVTRLEPVARDAGQRVVLEAELAKVEARGKGLKEISQEWPVVANRVRELEALSADLLEKSGLLGQELARARAWEAAGKTRRLVEDGEKLSAAILAARAERDLLGPVDPAAVTTLETREKERDRLRARLEAASLRVRFAATRAIRLETRSGIGAVETQALGEGGSLEFEAGGRVFLREATGAWEIEVASGEIDVSAEESRHREIGEELARGLAGLGVPDLAAAKLKLAAARDKAQRVALLEAQLAELLGSRTLDEWRAEADATGGGGTAPPRPLGEVTADRARTESETGAAARELAGLRQKIATWEKEYRSPDELIDHLADLRSEHKAVKQRLDALLPLPDEFPDANAFLGDFRAKQQAHERHRAEGHRLQVERAELSGTAPELEPADAADQLALAGAAFARATREGEALDRIRRDYEALRVELDQDTLGPWQNHLAGILAPLTQDRYRNLSPAAATASRSDDVAVPFAVLSAGTRASLGLALRLSMAHWFLEGRGGFLLLDDPLVDLDPVRQAAAAAMLRRFAGDTQVILFTCHPGHADLLGGDRVTL